jgi:hypothetical protein
VRFRLTTILPKSPDTIEIESSQMLRLTFGTTEN